MNRKAEEAWSDCEENRKGSERRLLPFGVTYLFHSNLAAGARQRKAEAAVRKKKRYI